jgi:phosphatidylethanolamine/phosphatidyl-N-methylethanolamine N-methyltransferase
MGTKPAEAVKKRYKPGGKVILLEHVLSSNWIISSLMNLANPMVVRMMGANINRRTVENVKISGLTIEKVTDIDSGIFKLIEDRQE